MLHRTYLAWWPVFFSAYFIPVYVSFIIVKNRAFAIGFVILVIYVLLKTTIFNVKLKNLMAFKKKIAW